VYKSEEIWNSFEFTKIRDINSKNVWDTDQGCQNCKSLEAAGLLSMRNGMNHGLGVYGQTDLSGPARIDLKFDIGCNLACRSCGPNSSTFWQKHLIQHGLKNTPVSSNKSAQHAITELEKYDLSNLKQLVFCGGETMLGNEYWKVASWLAHNIPNAKQQLTICFQTNGTQPLRLEHHDTIEKVHLVKMHVSLDGTSDRFNYLRWPADWNQVTDNILSIRQSAPGNVMFVVEETISIFNLAYLDELGGWVENNFVHNREGDAINHTRHLAQGTFNLSNLTQEYVDAVSNTNHKNLIPNNWIENPFAINLMIGEIKRFDNLRNESFENTFPEVAEYYSRFL
jgi:sulfatase maturation enzyme AslB (radical SAM superfamily)